MCNKNKNLYRFPVSIKGIVHYKDKILLLKNERNEWELPGGKLELNETPGACLGREILEEVNIKVEIKRIIDSWIYNIFADYHVLIITYACYEIESDKFDISNEHQEGRWFLLKELQDIKIPTGYRNSINRWYQIERNPDNNLTL